MLHWSGSALVLLVKYNTLILHSYFHRTLMFLLLVSVTFYRCIEKKGIANHFCIISRLLFKSCWSRIEQVAQRATIAHLSPMCQGQISFQKIQTHPSFNACSCYMKVSKGSNQKQQRKSGNTIFPIISSIGVFLRCSRAANSVVGGPIWPKFELIHNIMHVLVTSKFENDRININRDYVMTSIF